MLTDRFERLNALAKLNSAISYLEIGVNKGETFFKVSVDCKVAVDPVFLFNTEEYANEKTFFYQTTSDEFFSQFAPKHKKFDLIYLDGLHTFEQTFRDFLFSLSYSHSRTVWLIDDTCPISFLSAHPNIDRVRRLRSLITGEGLAWMGDVFKVVFAIHDFLPQFNWATFSGHGQTVIWQETCRDFKPVFNSLEAISRLGYDDFIELKDSFFQIMEDSVIFDCVRLGLSKQAF